MIFTQIIIAHLPAMKHLLIILCLFASISAKAQSNSFSGKITDSVSNKTLLNSVIALLHPGDSVLIKYTRADANGNFKLQNLDTGRYILMITHPYFADYVDNVEINSPDTKLSTVYITPKSKLLQEVIIKSGSPIRIKGDTTEYTADSFKLRANANVEDLLRKLPGIQVDKNGQITAMGEKVTKVLVDGEEFFGDDPGIATKNLRADAVDKVQVFDKKSDQATFTGIDDGKKDKTINLKLKDSKKNGYFGKAELGGGVPAYYNNSVMANAFKGKRKFAGYGIMSNTGKTQLDWSDARNYGDNSGIQTEFDDAGGMMMMSYSGDNNDNLYGGSNGIPINWNAGLHYSNKSSNSKQSINSGYKFAQVNAAGESSVFSKNFLPDSSWTTNSNTNTFNNSIKHAFNATYEVNIDSFNTLKYTAKANNRHSQSAKEINTESMDDDSHFIYTNSQRNNGTGDNMSFNNSLLWKHKFKKRFRTLSLNVTGEWIEVKDNGFLRSNTNFYKNNAIDRRDSIDQQNLGDNKSMSLTSKLAYTEPLFKDAFMEFSYAFNLYRNRNEKIVMKGINNKYEEIVDSLTNTYEFNRIVSSPGINFRLNRKKINYSLGTAIGINSYEQQNITTGTTISRHPLTYMPRASINYRLKGNSSLRINYNGNSKAPSLEQLQTIKTNNDPLNIYEGNPDLKQSFTHTISIGYNFWNVLKERGLWSNLSFSPVQNAFVNYSTLDSGVRHYKTVNANGNYNIGMNVNYNFKLKKTGIGMNAGPILNISRNSEYVNSLKNVTSVLSTGLELGMWKEKEKKYSLNLSPTFTYNHSAATINSNSNINYWQINGYAEGTVYIIPTLEFIVENQYQFRQRDPQFPANTDKVITNAGFKKNFKKDILQATLMIYDIFNQNTGFDRNFNSYNYTETRYTTLKRYGMLSITWNFNKNGAKPSNGF